MSEVATDLLPVDVQDGDPDHADLHNRVNAKANDLEAALAALPAGDAAVYRVAAPVVASDGDSITYGYGVRVPYPTLALDGISVAAVRGNFGVNGQQISDMLANAADVDGLRDPTRLCVVTALAGTNDIYNGRSAADTYADIVAYHQARRAVGWKSVVFTILPRNDATGGVTGAAHNTIRQAVNALIRANWQTFADALADAGADAVIGQLATCDDLTYFVDKCHPAPAGHAILARYMRAALAKLGVTGPHTHAQLAPSQDEIWVPAWQFRPQSVSADRTYDADNTVWLMPNNAASGFWAGPVTFPAHWASYTMTPLVQNHGAAGNAVLIGVISTVKPGSPRALVVAQPADSPLPASTNPRTPVEGNTTPVIVVQPGEKHSIALARDVGGPTEVGFLGVRLNVASTR